MDIRDDHRKKKVIPLSRLLGRNKTVVFYGHPVQHIDQYVLVEIESGEFDGCLTMIPIGLWMNLLSSGRAHDEEI